MLTIRSCLSVIAFAALALAPTSAFAQSTSMPTQTQIDGITQGSTSNPGWGSMAGGAAARPYVLRLTQTTAGVETVLIDGGTVTPPVTTVGVVTPVVSPANLCSVGQAPAQGQCYATPNRVGVMIGQATPTHADQDLTGAATVDTVFDMTMRLNTLGQSLRWSWANLDLLYWNTSNLGTPNAEFRIKFKPVITPMIMDFGVNNGCTSTPIGGPGPCNPTKSDLEMLAASITLSLDDTVNTALTGAIFATQGAIFGYLDPVGTAAAPVLDLQMAAAHYRPDGSTLQTGVMKALLPSQALLNIYGVLPADAATFFTATRSGAAGTQRAPTYSTWSAAVEGSDGLLITISDITFSSPTYQVKRKGTAAKATVKIAGGKTSVAINPVGACKAGKCTATVYKTVSAMSGKAVKVGVVTSSAKGSFMLSVAKAKLKKGTPYSVTIRLKKGGKLVTTAAGVAGGSNGWGSSSNSGGGGNYGGGGNRSLGHR